MDIVKRASKDGAPQQLLDKLKKNLTPGEVASLEVEYPDQADLLRDYQSFLYATQKIRFPIEDHNDKSKTRIAQLYADWLVEEHNTIPVYLNDDYSNRAYFTYVEKKGVWREISYNYVEKLAKQHLGSSWTRHTKQELALNFKSHPEAVLYPDMGLPPNEILLKNKKVLDLNDETGELRDITPHDYALNRINATREYHEPSTFISFMEDTFPDEDERKTIQEFLGWCLKYPDDRYQKALLILGDTNTGKSTFLKTVRELFKDCRISEVSLAQMGMERRFHLDRIAKSYLNIDEDMSSSELKDSSAIKQLICQEDIYVENKGESGKGVRPRAKLIMASNIAPSIENEHGAFYEKFLTVEAPNQVPQEKQDRQLFDKLTDPRELNGIFHYALKGLRRLEENDYFTLRPSPIETRRKWNNYGSDVDRFIAECVEKERGSHVPTGDAFEYYQMWKSEQMSEALSRKKFLRDMSKHPEIIKDRAEINGSNRRCFKNIRISVL